MFKILWDCSLAIKHNSSIYDLSSDSRNIRKTFFMPTPAIICIISRNQHLTMGP